MTVIRVQYDAYNRRFILLDPQGNLQDGETYLVIDFSADDFRPDAVISVEQTLAHA